jgi:hypothetical protein
MHLVKLFIGVCWIESYSLEYCIWNLRNSIPDLNTSLTKAPEISNPVAFHKFHVICTRSRSSIYGIDWVITWHHKRVLGIMSITHKGPNHYAYNLKKDILVSQKGKVPVSLTVQMSLCLKIDQIMVSTLKKTFHEVPYM